MTNLKTLLNRDEHINKLAQECGTLKTEAGELLRDWGYLYDSAELHATHELCNITKYLTITGGSIDAKYGHIYNKNMNEFTSIPNNEQASYIFGLAYTSSSDVAALWVCNVSAVLTYRPAWRLHGVAINTEFKAVFIFDEYNKDGEEIGMKCFDEKQMKQFIKNYENEQKAKNIDEFTAGAFEIAEKVPSILLKYAGKPYGEKTKQKINDELRTMGGDFHVWLDYNGVNVRKWAKFCGYNEQHFYFKFLDNNNKILTDITIQAEKPTKTATQAAKEQPKTAAKIKKLCMELLPLLEDYNKNAAILNQSGRDTNIMNANIYGIAKWGINE